MKHIIPAAALEQHTAVLGKNGSGKTYATKAVIVEPLLEAGKHVALVDPTSAWWGLRSSASGKGPGFKVIVLGGDHGDLPLPARGGEAVARLVIEQRVNVVVDTGNLTVGERTRWMVDFAGTIYRLNRNPLYLVLDEAHVFAPQGKVPDPDTGKMLHAVNQLASGGRSRGIRLTMLTQRPQKLHKDALTTADTLIAMRVLAPHDREAVKAWIDGCGDPAQGRQVLDSLAQLKRGEGWVWYPEGAHLVRVKFPAIKTFDSSATPTEGSAIAAPKGAAEVDLTEIRTALADAVKEAEANDPKLLRVRISDLERELKKGQTPVVVDQVAIAAARQEGREEGREEGARDGYAAGLRAVQPIADRLSTLGAAVTETIEGFQQDLRRLAASASKAAPQGKTDTGRPFSAAGGRGEAPAAAAARTGVARGSPGEAMPRAERQILIVLAQRHPKPATRSQMSILSGYSITSSSFSNALSGLRSKGFMEGYSDDNHITEAGLKALGSYEPLPTGRALVTWWLGRLGKAERAFFEFIVSRYPDAVSKEELAGETRYSITSSSYSNALSRLRTLELIQRGDIKASADLFD